MIYPQEEPFFLFSIWNMYIRAELNLECYHPFVCSENKSICFISYTSPRKHSEKHNTEQTVTYFCKYKPEVFLHAEAISAEVNWNRKNSAEKRCSFCREGLLKNISEWNAGRRARWLTTGSEPSRGIVGGLEEFIRREVNIGTVWSGAGEGGVRVCKTILNDWSSD